MKLKCDYGVPRSRLVGVALVALRLYTLQESPVGHSIFFSFWAPTCAVASWLMNSVSHDVAWTYEEMQSQCDYFWRSFPLPSMNRYSHNPAETLSEWTTCGGCAISPGACHYMRTKKLRCNTNRKPLLGLGLSFDPSRNAAWLLAGGVPVAVPLASASKCVWQTGTLFSSHCALNHFFHCSCNAALVFFLVSVTMRLESILCRV